jgi:hypothetical protein
MSSTKKRAGANRVVLWLKSEDLNAVLSDAEEMAREILS